MCHRFKVNVTKSQRVFQLSTFGQKKEPKLSAYRNGILFQRFRLPFKFKEHSQTVKKPLVKAYTQA